MNNIVSDFGEIKIHQNLIAQIAETVAKKVKGVAGLAITTDRWVSGFLASLRINGIKVDLSSTVSVTIPILVEYGYNAPEVAVQVQEEVVAALRQMLNIESAYIVVKVKGIGETKSIETGENSFTPQI